MIFPSAQAIVFPSWGYCYWTVILCYPPRFFWLSSCWWGFTHWVEEFVGCFVSSGCLSIRIAPYSFRGSILAIRFSCRSIIWILQGMRAVISSIASFLRLTSSRCLVCSWVRLSSVLRWSFGLIRSTVIYCVFPPPSWGPIATCAVCWVCCWGYLFPCSSRRVRTRAPSLCWRLMRGQS